MSKFNKVFLNTIIYIFSMTSLGQAAETQVYSWRGENGNIVLSEKKPEGDVEFKTIEVEPPTVVDTKTPNDSIDSQDVKIDQSDIEKLADSQLAKKNKEVLDETKKVTIQKVGIDSAEENVFTKDDKLAVITSPKLSGTDKLQFYVNGKPSPATFNGEFWEIPRPIAGENKITVKGETADNQKIASNTMTFYVKNATVLQMKNTGNYRGG